MGRLEDVCAKYREIGITSIRQTWFGQLKVCPKRATMDYFNRSNKTDMSFQALLGSVFHKCVELVPYGQMINVQSEKDWRDIIGTVWDEDPTTSYWFNNTILKGGNAKPLIDAIVTGAKTKSLSVIEAFNSCVVQTYGLLSTITPNFEAEVRMSANISGVEFYGTADCLSDGIIADVKTSGMWNELSVHGGKRGSIKGSSIDEDGVVFHSQLNHYRWLAWRTGRPVPGTLAIVTPVALIPRKNGSSELRGAPFATARAVISPQDYEDNMARILEGAISSGFPRFFPSEFGKSACAACAHKTACLASSAGSETSNDEIAALLAARGE